ncbi:MAG: hypothetical protein ACFFE2_12995 [Candidatus Thorarchaeota archaeon]
MKETKEILDDILHMEKSEYEILETSSSAKPKKRIKANVLRQQATVMLEETMDDMESYEPTQEMDFEVDEVKDCLEKKKKRRNYIEFRPDYEED